MFNIDLNPVELKKNIEQLQLDNEEIYDILKKIDNAVLSLDDKVWNSPEKKKINELLIPYLNNVKEIIHDNFFECNVILSNALNLYLETDKELKNKIDNK